MTPDRRDRRNRRTRGKARASVAEPRTQPSSDDAHDIAYFMRHPHDDPDQSSPGRQALNSWPTTVRAKARAALAAVAAAPPKRFAGGGYWEAMRGDMSGWFEVRVDGPNRHHYRLFCLLDYQAKDHDKPLLVVIDGRDKPFKTTLDDLDYAGIRALGTEYLSRNPRSIA